MWAIMSVVSFSPLKSLCAQLLGSRLNFFLKLIFFFAVRVVAAVWLVSVFMLDDILVDNGPHEIQIETAAKHCTKYRANSRSRYIHK